MVRFQTGWYTSFLLPTLKVKADECRMAGKNPEYESYSRKNLRKLNFHINELAAETGVRPGTWFSSLNYEDFSDFIADETKSYVDSVTTVVRARNRIFQDRKDSLVNAITERIGAAEFQKLREADYNESLANMVLNRLSTSKIYETDRKLIQKADPVLMKPGSRYGRAHFYAPFKQLGNMRVDTLLFNVIAIWIMTVGLFLPFTSTYLNASLYFLNRSGFRSGGNSTRALTGLT